MTIKKELLVIEKDVINDYVISELSLMELGKKYGFSGTAMRNLLVRNNVPRRKHGGRRDHTGRKKNIKTINYKAMINGKTLKEWQEYNTKVNNENKHFKIIRRDD